MSPNAAFEIAELADLTIDQLVAKFEVVHQEQCRSRNRNFIVRRIAWRIQANEEGGLSERALLRAGPIADESVIRVTPPKPKVGGDVDTTAPKLLGAWLVENFDERCVLDRLAGSEVLWERRVAVLATFSLIKNHEFEEIIGLAERLMSDGHDLMNKAIGWMLREMGKRDQPRLEKFLKKHAKVMPRTMLRYSIEKLSREDRTKWMNQ